MTQELYQRDREWHAPALTPNYKTSIPRSPRNALVAALDLIATIPLDAIADTFDIVLRGSRSSFLENRPEGN